MKKKKTVWKIRLTDFLREVKCHQNANGFISQNKSANTNKITCILITLNHKQNIPI